MTLLVALLDAVFCTFQFYRRARFGHWELWWVEGVNGAVWHRLTRCSVGAERPSGLCRGTPLCEEYGP